MRMLTVTVVTRMDDDGKLGIDVDVDSEIDMADESILSLARVSLEKAIEGLE